MSLGEIFKAVCTLLHDFVITPLAFSSWKAQFLSLGRTIFPKGRLFSPTMDSSGHSEPPVVWYIGLHDSKRLTPVVDETLRSAQEANVCSSFVFPVHADIRASMICSHLL